LTPWAVAAAAAWLALWTPARAIDVEVLRSTGGLPPHIVGTFREAINFQQAGRGGAYYVFDRRAHGVHYVAPDLSTSRLLVKIGSEEGNIIEPSAFDMDAEGRFVVADAPNMRERMQIFGPAGLRITGFTLPGRNAARLTLGTMVLNGVGTLQFTGRSILINQPEIGALITEYGLSGSIVRTFGSLRETGHERDRDLHLAFNVGLPLVNPKGGYYFVFQAGEPRFLKYDASGKLVLERLMQGPEIDELLSTMPTTWGRRRSGEDVPLVPPLVRTAAVAPDGALWVSLASPYTYVFDSDGDKVRVVQLRGGTGVLSPTSLFFAESNRLLVTPGCFEFQVSKARSAER